VGYLDRTAVDEGAAVLGTENSVAEDGGQLSRFYNERNIYPIQFSTKAMRLEYPQEGYV